MILVLMTEAGDSEELKRKDERTQKTVHKEEVLSKVVQLVQSA
jgi:hypothetical protein